MRQLPIWLTLLALPSVASAQVRITEVQPNPTSTNDDGEWIELQNLGTDPVDVTGYTLNDFSGATESGTRWAFTSTTVLQPGQVIVVAKFASGPGYADNQPTNLYATPPSFELGTQSHDDAGVPNLAPSGGTSLISLANGGDAVVLRDAQGNYVDGVEWGSTDTTVVPGSPVAGPGSAESIGRVNTGGSSDVDFTVLATPTPFVGLDTSAPTPPAITNFTVLPRHLLAGDDLVVTATVTDADGLDDVSLFSALASTATGAAGSAYTAQSMTSQGSMHLGVIAAPGSPADFHSLYVRAFVEATDSLGDLSTMPNGATLDADNGAYEWRNVVPLAAADVSEVRVQSGGRLRYRLHSARVEGVVLTRRAAFVQNRTNFFVRSTSSGEAIRVFSSDLIPVDVQPGDLVRITGMLDEFNGLRQIGEPEVAVELLGQGLPVPPVALDLASLLADAELHEGQLVEIANLNFVTPPSNWPNNGNVDVTDGTGTVTVRVVSSVDLSGTPAPTGSFTLRGIFSQFSASGIGGYQLLPRGLADVDEAAITPDAGVPDTGLEDAGASPDAGIEVDAGLPPFDAGTPPVDAGLPPFDAGVPPVDAGLPPFDAGTPPVDAGTPPVDAGTPPTDAGTELDAGTPPTDAGTPPVDAGTPPFDAGTPPTDAAVEVDAGSPPADAAIEVDAGTTPDAGTPPADAGTPVDAATPPVDAGTPVDAATPPVDASTTDAGTTDAATPPVDAGTTPDAGAKADAGAKTDAGTDGTDEKSCGCATTEPGSTSSPAWALGLLGALGLVRRRRRV